MLIYATLSNCSTLLYDLPINLQPNTWNRRDADIAEDISRHTAGNATAQSKIAQAKIAEANTESFPRNKDPYQISSPHTTSAPSSPPRRTASGTVTPPPNSRNHKRTSTPPGDANSIQRTGSRHSKSSSDGSWDTPAPASPPQISSGSTFLKPPHARNTPVSKTRRKSGGRDENAVEDLTYKMPWMCGFADAFNFGDFDKFQK